MGAGALTEEGQTDEGWKEKVKVSESAHVVSFGFYEI